MIPFNIGAQVSYHARMACPTDPHELPEVVRRLRRDDARAARIAAAGREFAMTHLNKRARLCYWRALIRELADAFDYT